MNFVEGNLLDWCENTFIIHNSYVLNQDFNRKVLVFVLNLRVIVGANCIRPPMIPVHFQDLLFMTYL